MDFAEYDALLYGTVSRPGCRLEYLKLDTVRTSVRIYCTLVRYICTSDIVRMQWIVFVRIVVYEYNYKYLRVVHLARLCTTREAKFEA